jgi:hypothetical protein
VTADIGVSSRGRAEIVKFFAISGREKTKRSGRLVSPGLAWFFLRITHSRVVLLTGIHRPAERRESRLNSSEVTRMIDIDTARVTFEPILAWRDGDVDACIASRPTALDSPADTPRIRTRNDFGRHHETLVEV